MPIPDDSETWLYGLTGMMAMVGVPVMAVAMAEIAQVLMFHGKLDEAKAIVDAAVTKEELEFLQEIGLEEFNGEVDKTEFIILCMIRMGTDPGLITYITQRFAELNFYNGNALTVAEITQGACRFVDGRVRRKVSVAIGEPNFVSESDHVVPDASMSYLHYSHIKPAKKDAASGCSADEPPEAHQRLQPILEGSARSAQSEAEKFDVSEDVAGNKSSSGAPIYQNGSLRLEDVFRKSIDLDQKRRATMCVLQENQRVDWDEVSESASEGLTFANQATQSISLNEVSTSKIAILNENSTATADNPPNASITERRPIRHSLDPANCVESEDIDRAEDVFMNEMEEGRSQGHNWNSVSAIFDVPQQEHNTVSKVIASETVNQRNVRTNDANFLCTRQNAAEINIEAETTNLENETYTSFLATSHTKDQSAEREGGLGPVISQTTTTSDDVNYKGSSDQLSGRSFHRAS
jgi:hypothetical protein